MNSQLFSSPPGLSLLCFLLVILLKIQSSSSNPYNCPAQFECGNITASYPFWDGHMWWEPLCGHPELSLYCDPGNHLTTMMINDVKYRVLDINSTSQTLRIAILMSQSFERVCLKSLTSTSNTFNSEVFNYSGDYENVTLQYGCPPSSIIEPRKGCTPNGIKYEHDFVQADGPKYWTVGCHPNAIVPVPKPLPEIKANWSDWVEILNHGFELKWKIGGVPCKNCTNSNGNCWFENISNETSCYCPHITPQPINEPCPHNLPDHVPQAPPDQAP